ncbi:hypothetical protein ET495_07505 [Xylanimonas allomyrinae]|uniref:Cell wall protein n=1 Tax=Xylanimonas allomyrinae TaxID=2509459 RepID=A0A4P6ELH7_9MICO|nr:TIGR03773 family transporter-associated surface protein [Xylanimonas allomyrinae]QAY63116.1 hypothetical protein ET495_07505 [Xylanimonas allomyrinae]
MSIRRTLHVLATACLLAAGGLAAAGPLQADPIAPTVVDAAAIASVALTYEPDAIVLEARTADGATLDPGTTRVRLGGGDLQGSALAVVLDAGLLPAGAFTDDAVDVTAGATEGAGVRVAAGERTPVTWTADDDAIRLTAQASLAASGRPVGAQLVLERAPAADATPTATEPAAGGSGDLPASADGDASPSADGERLPAATDAASAADAADVADTADADRSGTPPGREGPDAAAAASAEAAAGISDRSGEALTVAPGPITEAPVLRSAPREGSSARGSGGGAGEGGGPGDGDAPAPAAPSEAGAPGATGAPGAPAGQGTPASGTTPEQCIATGPAAPAGAVDVVTEGHLDFGPVLEDGTLRALVKDDRASPPRWVDPAGLVLHVQDNAAVQAPGGDFAFLGSGQVWQIPLTQASGVPWLGWNTQHESVAGKTDGNVTLSLDALDGPGRLAVYSMGSFGNVGEKFFGTVDGFGRSTEIPVGASGVHVHAIWAFTEPGAYHATLTFSGTVAGQPRTATTTLTFFVGPGDPASAARPGAATTGRTPDGRECSLAAGTPGPGNGAPGGPTLPRTGPALTGDLAGLAVALGLVGLAFLGAAALAPRAARTSHA